jgi:hypothetical protein
VGICLQLPQELLIFEECLYLALDLFHPLAQPVTAGRLCTALQFGCRQSSTL